MTDYKKKSIKYGATIYAAIILVALIVASFIYSLIMSQPEDIDDYVIETTDSGVSGITPSSDEFPTSAPDVTPPTTPPGEASAKGLSASLSENFDPRVQARTLRSKFF